MSRRHRLRIPTRISPATDVLSPPPPVVSTHVTPAVLPPPPAHVLEPSPSPSSASSPEPVSFADRMRLAQLASLESARARHRKFMQMQHEQLRQARAYVVPSPWNPPPSAWKIPATLAPPSTSDPSYDNWLRQQLPIGLDTRAAWRQLTIPQSFRLMKIRILKIKLQCTFLSFNLKLEGGVGMN